MDISLWPGIRLEKVCETLRVREWFHTKHLPWAEDREKLDFKLGVSSRCFWKRSF